MLSEILDAFSIPKMSDLVPRSFLHEHGIVSPQQYGIAARDVRACAARAEALGAGPFIVGSVPAPNWHERGRKKKGVVLEVALGYAGDAQIEFLGPGRGTTFYGDALDGRETALHHVGAYQPGMDAVERSLARAGFERAVRGGTHLGRLCDFDFRYFDCREELGFYVEILDFSALGRPLDIGKLIRAYSALARRWSRR